MFSVSDLKVTRRVSEGSGLFLVHSLLTRRAYDLLIPHLCVALTMNVI